MAGLHTKIKLYLEANSKTEEELYSDNIELQNDGSGKFGMYLALLNQQIHSLIFMKQQEILMKKIKVFA